MNYSRVNNQIHQAEFLMLFLIVHFHWSKYGNGHSKYSAFFLCGTKISKTVGGQQQTWRVSCVYVYGIQSLVLFGILKKPIDWIFNI